MDQTINEMMYKARIDATVHQWNEQINNGNTSSGSIIGRDGTTYKKVDGRLVQVIEPNMKKCIKRLSLKLMEDSLVRCESSAPETVTVATTELIAGL